MAPAEKLEKYKITNTIRGLMTTVDKPLRPIRSCRLNKLEGHVKNKSIVNSPSKTITFNNLLSSKKFEFRSDVRQNCPQCYTVIKLEDLMINIKISKQIINTLKGYEEIEGFSEFAIAKCYDKTKKKSNNIQVDTVYAEIEAFQLHGANLAPLFFTIGCTKCNYKCHIFPNKNFPNNILRFRIKKIKKTFKISPKLIPFKYAQKQTNEPNTQYPTKPTHSISIKSETRPKLTFTI